MNVDDIVAAGIRLADEEGLGNLSIRKLASSLGSGTMSAYRHVQSREQLVQLMVDAALGTPPAAIGDGADWRERTTRWVDAIVARYLEHSWLTEAPVTAGIATRHRAEWLEALLLALEESTLTVPQLLDAALLIDGHARATASLARLMGGGSPPPEPTYDAAEFPLLTRAFATGALSADGALESDFGLQRILDGIEVFARRS